MNRLLNSGLASWALTHGSLNGSANVGTSALKITPVASRWDQESVLLRLVGVLSVTVRLGQGGCSLFVVDVADPLQEQKWEDVARTTEVVMRLNPYDFPQAVYYNAVANSQLERLDIAEKSAREALAIGTPKRCSAASPQPRRPPSSTTTRRRRSSSSHPSRPQLR